MKAAAVISPNPDLAKRFQQVLSLSHGDNMNMLGLYAYIAAYEKGDEYLEQLLTYLAGNVAHLQKASGGATAPNPADCAPRNLFDVVGLPGHGHGSK